MGECFRTLSFVNLESRLGWLRNPPQNNCLTIKINLKKPPMMKSRILKSIKVHLFSLASAERFFKLFWCYTDFLN